MRVLVVDDDKDIADAIAFLIEQDDPVHGVYSTVSADTATAYLESGTCDVMFTDFDMLTCTGHDLCRLSRSANDKCVNVLVTGSDAPSTVLLISDVDYLIRKPFRYHDILHVLRNARRRESTT